MSLTYSLSLKSELEKKGVTLVAVSKTKPVELIKMFYDHGFRDFGENRVQELIEKHEQLPGDIRWHLIGNLQKNKVKYIASFVHLIHSVSSENLLLVIDKEARKNDRVIDVLLQVKIADEDSKSGMTKMESQKIIADFQEGKYPNVHLKGFMGMATFTDDQNQIRQEFRNLRKFSEQVLPYSLIVTPAHTPTPTPTLKPTLSMGMSGDFEIAVEEGSNMVRIGSLLFGAR